MTTSRGLLRRFRLSQRRELPPITLAQPNAFGFVSNLTRPVISSNGEWMAVGGWSTLWVMRLADGAPSLKVLTGWEQLRDLDFAPTGSELALLTHERVAVVDVGTGKLVRSTALERGIHVGGAIRYRPDGRQLLVLAGETLTAFDASSAALLGTLASEVDDSVDGHFAVAQDGLWVHPDGNKRLLLRMLPGPTG
ncbi:MAG: hypothetical protein JRI23_26305 [Deltaproteobacteria bacterium]|nr:hypothetical protein [Deltaproteobacteria bacterium]MBW2535549.1 hypothetical protein [Deltaproteobacteria bacterium]